MSDWLFLHIQTDNIQHPDNTFIATLDGVKITDSASLFQEIAKVLKFPDYFGNNWDALDECLCDLEWIPASGYVIVWQNASNLLLNSPDEFLIFLDVLHYAAQQWRQKNVRMELHIRDDKVLGLARWLQRATLPPD